MESRKKSGRFVGNHYTEGQLRLMEDLVSHTGLSKAVVVRDAMKMYADSLGVQYSNVDAMAPAVAATFGKRKKVGSDD